MIESRRRMRQRKGRVLPLKLKKHQIHLLGLHGFIDAPSGMDTPQNLI
jgi:hypothetical protein